MCMHKASENAYLLFCGNFKGQEQQQRGQRGATGGSTYSASASHIGGLTKIARSQDIGLWNCFPGFQIIVFFVYGNRGTGFHFNWNVRWARSAKHFPFLKPMVVFFNTIDCRNGQSLGSCQNERICGRINVLNGLTRLFLVLYYFKEKF